jgi:RimJ/RimL family protein N-acetyltransferase/anti-anti-sigma regulatory factor
MSARGDEETAMDAVHGSGAVRGAGREGLHADAHVLRVHGDLTLAMAPALCRSVREALAAGGGSLAVDLRDAKAVDIVGLAALLQCGAAVEGTGAAFSVVAPEALHQAVTAARLCEEIPFVTGVSDADADIVEAPRLPEEAPLVARTARLGLRPPTWDELTLFARWAADRRLDEMVGSDLLYRCRHLGPYHPDFVTEMFASPTSLTLLVEPLESPGQPVGFVRLYDIQLAEGIAFLETVVTTRESLRKGWGVEASRLLLAYAMDVLGIRRVEAKVYAYNVLSANALRRNGFREEGALRAAHRYHGEQWDILVFSILEDEMLAQRTRGTYPYVGFWNGPCGALKSEAVPADERESTALAMCAMEMKGQSA